MYPCLLPPCFWQANHRIIEWLGLEGTFNIISFQPRCYGQTSFLQNWKTWIWDSFQQMAERSSSGELKQWDSKYFQTETLILHISKVLLSGNWPNLKGAEMFIKKAIFFFWHRLILLGLFFFPRFGWTTKEKIHCSQVLNLHRFLVVT